MPVGRKYQYRHCYVDNYCPRCPHCRRKQVHMSCPHCQHCKRPRNRPRTPPTQPVATPPPATIPPIVAVLPPPAATPPPQSPIVESPPDSTPSTSSGVSSPDAGTSPVVVFPSSSSEDEDADVQHPDSPAGPARCRDDCTCCMPRCPCSERLACICICHDDQPHDRASPGDAGSPGSNPPGMPPQDSHPDGSLPSGSFPPRRPQSEKPVARVLPMVRPNVHADFVQDMEVDEWPLHDNSGKRPREDEVEAREEVSSNSTDQYLPEAIVRMWGFEDWRNESDGRPVSKKMKTLGFNSLPPYMSEKRARRKSFLRAAVRLKAVNDWCE